MTKTRLKDILKSGTFVLAPGVFDMFSARVADRIGFPALYVTGYGVSGSFSASRTLDSSPIATWWSARARLPMASACR